MDEQTKPTELLGTGIPNFKLRKNGIYYVVKVIAGEQKWISTKKRDKKAALIVYHRIMRDLNEDGEVAQLKPFFKDWWEDYRETVTLPDKTSPKNDDGMIKHYLPDWGTKRLDAINEIAIRKALARRRREGASEGTITKELGFLQAMFAVAVRNRVITFNPFIGIPREGYEIRDRVLTHEEQEKLLAAFEPYELTRKDGKTMPFEGNASFARFIQFLLGTGLRLEEARLIDPKVDIHLEERWIRVTRKSKGKKKKVQQIPLFDDDVIEVIREQLEAEGKLWDVSQVALRTMLARGAVRAGIDHVWPHALRHTFATRFLQAAPEKIYTLSMILGHSSVTITEKIYAHMLKEDLLKAANGISMGLKPKPSADVLEFKKEA